MNARTKLLALFVLLFAAAALLAGCAVAPTVPTDTYFIGQERVQIDVEYLHRYTCANDAPLSCVCASIRLGQCDCRC